WFAQINFILLLFIVLFWRDRHRARAGIWLLFGIILKPYVAVLVLYLVIKRQWGPLVTSAIALVSTSLLSIVVFGWKTFTSYFFSFPASKLPPWFFTEYDKGNLYATTWRMINKHLGESSLNLVLPIYAGISLIVILITAWLIYQLLSSHEDWARAIILSLGLFLYPNTGTNYYVALIAPMFLLWSYKDKVPAGIWFVAIVMTLETAFFSYQRGWSKYVFLGMGLGWFALFALGLALLVKKWQNRANTLRNDPILLSSQ
ncbi:MAG: glycosyltransferase family 87 protein, partial [Chloroflexota bacterium]